MEDIENSSTVIMAEQNAALAADASFPQLPVEIWRLVADQVSFATSWRAFFHAQTCAGS